MISFLNNTRFGDKPLIDLMLETPTSKEIRICMDVGTAMQEHTAPGAIMIMVLEGEVSISWPDHEAVLRSGDMLFFEAKVPHSLEALQRSVIRLTLSKNDTFKRVVGLV